MKWKDYYDYGIIALIFVIIFWSNLFSNLFLLDFVPNGNVLKSLTINNYANLSLLQPLIFLFNLLHLQSVFFQLIILITMLVSYYYIKKLTKHPLFFAFIYFFNPFIYSRIMVGQIGVILAFLLLPAFIHYILDKDKSSIYKAALVVAIIGAIQPHFFVICMGMFFLSLFFFNHNRKPKPIILFIILTIAISAFWVQGLLQRQIFYDITSSHELFFAPKLSQNIPAIGKIMAMYGFWREPSYQVSYHILPLGLWYVLLSALIALLLTGYFHKSSKQQHFYFSLWWIGILLAAGVSHPYTQNLFNFLFSNIPFFNGFRDSHKFVALIALAYAFFIPEGVAYVGSKIKNKLIPIFITVLIIIVMASPLINLNNQVHGIYYPDSYKKTADYLDNKEIKGHIIYLPWELYLTYNWTISASPDGRIPAPINNIVKPIIITGPEALGSTNDFQKNITGCLANQSIDCLASQNVEYILKDSCAFYPETYAWINTTPVHEDACITIYHLNSRTITASHQPLLRLFAGLIISILGIIAVIYLIKKP
jgi:hypothetical protein